MTISTQVRTAGPFSGTGVGGIAYPFLFKVFQAADLVVYRADASGVQTLLTLSSNYTVALNADQNVAPGGTVTLVVALPVGYTLTISSNIPITQPTSLPTGGPFFAQVVENALDRLTILQQQAGYVGGAQSLRVPEIGGVSVLPQSADRAGKILRFNAVTGDVELATSIGETVLSRSVIGDYFLPRTQAEIDAGVVPTATFWPPGDVRRYGAVLATNDVANEAANDAAFARAKAANSRIFIDSGYFNTAAGLRLDRSGLWLAGAGQLTQVICSSDNYMLHIGGVFGSTFLNGIKVSDIAFTCTSRAATTMGIKGTSAAYCKVVDCGFYGSGNPNDPDPANYALYGSGDYLTDNFILSAFVRCRWALWDKGLYMLTDPEHGTNQSRWAAANTFVGCNFDNCMRLIDIGDPTVNLYCGTGCTFIGTGLQGAYTTGVRNSSGDGVRFIGGYAEGNANYDFLIGSPSGSPLPIGNSIMGVSMSSGDIGATAYGTFPYIHKVFINKGLGTVVDHCNMSIGTSIALVGLAAGAEASVITKCRLNSAAAATDRIDDSGVSTVTRDNYPEQPHLVVGEFTIDLSAGNGSFSITDVGLRASGLDLDGAIDGTAAIRCTGKVGFESGVQQWCRTWNSSNVPATSASFCLKFIGATSGDYMLVTFNTMDPDGWTMTRTVSGTPPTGTAKIGFTAWKS